MHCEKADSHDVGQRARKERNTQPTTKVSVELHVESDEDHGNKRRDAKCEPCSWKYREDRNENSGVERPKKQSARSKLRSASQSKILQKGPRPEARTTAVTECERETLPSIAARMSTSVHRIVRRHSAAGKRSPCQSTLSIIVAIDV